MEPDASASQSSSSPRNNRPTGALVVGFVCALLVAFCAGRQSVSQPSQSISQRPGADPVISKKYPRKYGSVHEKTIWFYYNSGFDPMPSALVSLCLKTWVLHHPDWNIVYLSDKNVHDYVHPRWLPDQWASMEVVASKKDAVMAAILAVYGGVAADTTVICFKSMTTWWNEMLENNQTFRGFVYRKDRPWGPADGAAVWFFMARRDSGIFRRYTQDIILRMGDGTTVSSSFPGDSYLALGGMSIEPILEEVDPALPTCRGAMPGNNHCSQNPFHVDSNAPLFNERITTTDPLNYDYGPQLEDVSSLQSATSWTGFMRNESRELWSSYEHRKSHPEFKILKIFQHGGPWLRSQSDPAAILQPPNTPEEELTIISVWFKDAGLVRGQSIERHDTHEGSVVADQAERLSLLEEQVEQLTKSDRELVRTSGVLRSRVESWREQGNLYKHMTQTEREAKAKLMPADYGNLSETEKSRNCCDGCEGCCDGGELCCNC